jgi:hypothetical protein
MICYLKFAEKLRPVPQAVKRIIEAKPSRQR